MKNKSIFLRNLIALNLIISPAYSGDLTIVPSLEVEAIASSNVRPVEDEGKSSLISVVTPKLLINYDASRAGFDIDIRNSFIGYSENNVNSGQILKLSTNGFLELTEDGLILFASANIANRSKVNDEVSLENINPNDAVQMTHDSIGLKYNTSNSDFYIDSIVIGEKIDSDDNGDKKEGVDFNLSSGNSAAARNILWYNNLSLQKYSQLDRHYQYYNGELVLGLMTNFHVNPFIRAYAEDLSGNITGESDNNMESLGAGINMRINESIEFFISYNETIEKSSIDEDYISTSIKWNPSDRTSLYFNYGKRFFGDSYEFKFNQELNKVKTSISYNESIRAFDNYSYDINSLGFYLCPDNMAQNINNCILKDDNDINLDNYIYVEFNERVTNRNKEHSLTRELNWENTFNTNIAELRIFALYTNEERLESQIINETLRTGINLNKDINELSKGSFSIEYVDTKYDKDKTGKSWQDTNYMLYKLDYQRELNSTLSAKLNFQYVDVESSRLEHNYDEARIGLSFTKEF